jgi:hypothetical protein
MEKETGGPAYPACNEANVNDTMGMTLRDYLAGQALAGHMTKIYVAEKETELEASRLAKRAYRTADAMLKERSK